MLLFEQYAAAVDLAMDARTPSTLIATTRRDCVLDNDHCVQRMGGTARATRASARTRAPPARPARQHAQRLTCATTPAPAPALTTTPTARASTEMISFKAGLLTGRQSGMRKADLAILGVVKEPHEMARGNITWYLADGRGGYVHVSELPAAHVLVDNECACLRPAASKADQTAQHFGNQLVYLPVIHNDDANNAALALAALERSSLVNGTARIASPLLVSDAHVDDLIITGNDAACMFRFKKKLIDDYDVTD